MNVAHPASRQIAADEFRLSDPIFMTDELRMLRDQVRRFVDTEVLPHGEAWEEQGKVPREIYVKLGELGMLGMRPCRKTTAAQTWGPLASVVFAEELSRSTFGGFVSGVLVHTDMSSPHISISGTAAQKQKYLPDIIAGKKVCAVAVTEPGAGSDVAGLRTKAVRDGDHWVLNGTKMFITNGVYGDIYIVAARTDPTARAARGISLFIVEKGDAGFPCRPQTRQARLAVFRHGRTRVRRRPRVPAANLLGEEGRGFYAIMGTFQNERLVIGAMAAGESAKAIDLTLDYVRTRTAFGATLWNLQGTRLKLAELVARVAGGRAPLLLSDRGARSLRARHEP